MQDWHEYNYYSTKEDENKKHPLLFRITLPEKMTSDIIYNVFKEISQLQGGNAILNNYGIKLIQ